LAFFFNQQEIVLWFRLSWC